MKAATTRISLRPCPFCGERRQRRFKLIGVNVKRVVCGFCEAVGPEGNNPQGAAMRWNYRPVDARRRRDNLAAQDDAERTYDGMEYEDYR